MTRSRDCEMCTRTAYWRDKFIRWTLDEMFPMLTDMERNEFSQDGRRPLGRCISPSTCACGSLWLPLSTCPGTELGDHHTASAIVLVVRRPEVDAKAACPKEVELDTSLPKLTVWTREADMHPLEASASMSEAAVVLSVLESLASSGVQRM